MVKTEEDSRQMLSPRDLVSRPDIMDETVPHTRKLALLKKKSNGED